MIIITMQTIMLIVLILWSIAATIEIVVFFLEWLSSNETKDYWPFAFHALGIVAFGIGLFSVPCSGFQMIQFGNITCDAFMHGW